MPYIKIFINGELAKNLLDKDKRDRSLVLLSKGLKDELEFHDRIKEDNYQRIFLSTHNTRNEFWRYKHRGIFKVIIKDFSNGKPDYVKLNSLEDVKKLRDMGSYWERMSDEEKSDWFFQNFYSYPFMIDFLRFMLKRLDKYDINRLFEVIK